MTRTFKMLAVGAAMMLAPLAATPVSAQLPVVPTPAGTVITNTATVNYGDANGNTYAATSAPVSVTVVFKAGVDVFSASATVNPASPTAAATYVTTAFTIQNNGNDTDKYSVNITTGAGLTNVSYVYNSVEYADLTALNAALALVSVAAPTNADPTVKSISVAVKYRVADALGGSSIPIAFSATSLADGTVTDTYTVTVAPPTAGSVTVVANQSSISRLPNGTALANYSTTFAIHNDANYSRSFTLGAASSNTANGAIVSTNGTAGAASTITIAANSIGSVTVVYTVANVSTPAGFNVTLTATSSNGLPVATDDDAHAVTIVKPVMTIVKTAYNPARTTALAANASVKPGDIVWYKIVITNTGSADAATVSITDVLNNQLAYVSNLTDGSDWNVATSTNGTTGAITVTATLTGIVPAAPATSSDRTIWIQTTVR